MRDWSELKETEKQKYNQEADRIHERLVAIRDMGESSASRSLSKNSAKSAVVKGDSNAAENSLAKEAADKLQSPAKVD